MDFLASLGRIPFNGDRISRFGAAEEAVLGNRSAAQAGNRGNPGEQIELEAGDRRALVASGGSINSEKNQIFPAVAKVYFAESGEATNKKPGRNEENHGDGNLCNYQDFPRGKAPVGPFAGCSALSGLQNRGEIEARGVQGGNQGKEDCGEQRHTQGETEHPRVRL